MFSITLLVSPKSSSLDPVLVENLRSAWGGDAVNWLARAEAAEFQVRSQPDNFWATWEDLQSLGVDLISQSNDGRKKQILIADMDSTMIQQECIDELAAEAGVGEAVADITAQAMNGELNFEGALIERVLMLKGIKTSVIDSVLNKRITLTPGGLTLLATMKAHGAYCALVSGGFTAFTEIIAARLGFDENSANQLLSAKGALTGEVKRPILGRDAKVFALKKIAKRLGFAPDQVMAVGDGANDLGMLNLAGAGVALHAKPSVAAQCDIRINHGDLTALLFLQGYRRAEFIE